VKSWKEVWLIEYLFFETYSDFVRQQIQMLQL